MDALVGDFGVDEKLSLEDQRSALSEEIRALEARREQLDDRTSRLIGPEIDRDLLDEQLRAAFGLGREDEALLLPPERLR